MTRSSSNFFRSTAKEKLDKLTADFEPVKDAVEESAGNVFAAMKLVCEEVVGSFDRIRKSLDS